MAAAQEVRKRGRSEAKFEKHVFTRCQRSAVKYTVFLTSVNYASIKLASLAAGLGRSLRVEIGRRFLTLRLTIIPRKDQGRSKRSSSSSSGRRPRSIRRKIGRLPNPLPLPLRPNRNIYSNSNNPVSRNRTALGTALTS